MTARKEAKASRPYRSMINRLLEEYIDEVNASPLAESSKVDYIMFAQQFVRWMNFEFEPGGTLYDG